MTGVLPLGNFTLLYNKVLKIKGNLKIPYRSWSVQKYITV